jgi:hypothetical protein
LGRLGAEADISVRIAVRKCKILGMQLGRAPSDDEEVDYAYRNVLTKLKDVYGFKQLDWTHFENCIHLEDEQRLFDLGGDRSRRRRISR